MKKVLWFLILIFLGIPSISFAFHPVINGIIASSAVPSESYILDQDFNGPDGTQLDTISTWTYETDNGQFELDTARKQAGGSSVLCNANGVNVSEIYHTFTNSTSGIITIDFYLNIDDVSQSSYQGGLVVSDGSWEWKDDYAGFWRFFADRIYETDTQIFSGLSADTQIHIQIECDIDGKTFDFYVDNTLETNDQAWRDTGSSGLSMITFYVTNNNSVKHWYDELKIYSGTRE